MEAGTGSPPNGRLLLCVSVPLALAWSRPFAYGSSAEVLPLMIGLLVAGLAGSLGVGRVPRSALAWVGLVLLALLLRASSVPLYNLMLLPVALAVCAGFALGDAAAHHARVARAIGLGLAAGLAVNFLAALIQFLNTGSPLQAWWLLPGGWATGSSRPHGNLGQANHFGMFFALSLAPLWWMTVRRSVPPVVVAGLVACASLMVALSGSRIAVVCVFVFALLAWVWRRSLPARTLPAFLAAPLLVLLFAWGSGLFALQVGQGGAGVLQRDAQTISLRLFHWQATLEMIAAHPWAGVGWREYLYGRFLMRPEDFAIEPVEHAHNLLLHLAAELGVPLALLIVGPVLVFAVRARPWQERDPARQTGWLVLVLIFVYSQVEFPLWVMSFLFLAAIAAGLVLADPDRTGSAEAADAAGAQGTPAPGMRWNFPGIAGWLLVASTLAAWVDYDRAVSPVPQGALLDWGATTEERVAVARRSALFGTHVDMMMLSVLRVNSQNYPEVLRQTGRLMHFSPDAPVLKARLAALCLADDAPGAGEIDRLLQRGFPAEHAAFLGRLPPQFVARCGLGGAAGATATPQGSL